MFDEAQKLMNDYEKSNPPSLVMYSKSFSHYYVDQLFLYILVAILSGARNHRNTLLSQTIYNRMKCLFPNQKEAMIAGSILLSNTFSSMGDDEQAKDIQRIRIKEYGSKVKIGLSWTEVNGEIVVSDLS